MFVNCYDDYGFCLFTVRVREGVKAERLGSYISNWNELVDFWKVADYPEGAIVTY